MINYYASETRDSPINLTVARLLLTSILIYKLIKMEWDEIPNWPSPLIDIYWANQQWLFDLLPILATICGISLVFVAIGYYLRLNCYISAVLLTVLGTVRTMYNPSHEADLLMIGSLLLLLFAIFPHQSKLTVDELRRTNKKDISELNTHLKETGNSVYNHSPLRWGLVIFGVVYFQGGFTKIFRGEPLEWIHPSSLNRFILYGQVEYGAWMPIGDLFLQYPILVWMGSIGTLVLELGLLIAILTRIRVDIILLGLIGMHAAIAFSVGPVFSDMVPFLLMFAPWDTLWRNLQRKTSVKIVYDEHCYFCARSLYLFRYLDLQNNVNFYTQYTAPKRLQEEDANFKKAMYSFREEKSYRGYYAFVTLINQFRLLSPIAWLMLIPGIKYLGVIVYEYVAKNRNRHFVCSVE